MAKPSKTTTSQNAKHVTEVSNEASQNMADEKKGAPVETEITYRRNMTGKKEIFTDLFKLMVAKVIKYEGWDEPNEHPDSHPQKFSTWEHTHPFRTYDKQGAKMTTCTPIGGHFHVVEWEDVKTPDSPPRIKNVSGPMVMKKEKIKGRFVQSYVPANDYDDHSHDVEYVRSSKIEFSTINIEAAQVIAYEAQKTAPLPGVSERG